MPRLRGLKLLCIRYRTICSRWNHYAPSKGIETSIWGRPIGLWVGITMPRLRGLKLLCDIDSGGPPVGMTMPRLRGLKLPGLRSRAKSSWNHYAPSKGIETFFARQSSTSLSWNHYAPSKGIETMRPVSEYSTVGITMPRLRGLKLATCQKINCTSWLESLCPV